jgi:hypothetical protein
MIPLTLFINIYIYIIDSSVKKRCLLVKCFDPLRNGLVHSNRQIFHNKLVSTYKVDAHILYIKVGD